MVTVHGVFNWIMVYQSIWIFGAHSQDVGNSQNSEVHYTRIDELPDDVTVGNIIHDASLDIRYELDVLDSFIFDIIGGQHMGFFHMDTEHLGNLKTSKFIDRDLVCQNAEDCDIVLDVAIVQPSEYFQVIQVTLTLLDINDNIPEFIKSEETLHISENAMPPVSFVLPTATDPDSPTYSIKSYSFTRRSSKFDLELIENSDGTQDLRLKLLERLDREIQSSYNLQVQALDGGKPAKVGLLDIQIIVMDANDNVPVFERDMYNISVREDHSIASPFLKVKATDSDEGLNGQVIYSLSDQFMDIFNIDSQSGEISLIKELDYEKQTSYHLLVTATDQGPDSVPVHVRVVINVEDVNDFLPKISVNAWTESGQLEVMENEVRSFVAHVSVTDEDTGLSGKVRCQVTDSRFTLEEMYRKRYKIVTTTMLDREKEDLIKVNIQCQDQGIPSLSDSLQITIHVLDQNDNPPIFLKSTYTVNIPETSHIGYSVLTVMAKDADVDSNSQISYHLHANSNNLLRIDSINGVITTNSLLDYETMDHLNFYILAIDGGDPSFTATATVSMTITDVNDEKPIFGQPSYNFGTFENQLPGTEIGTVQATDNDAAPNDAFIFTLSDNSTFSINPINGLITSNKILDREHEAAYYLYVQATDIELPYLSSTASLTIYVADRNDNAPRITFPNDDNNTIEISSFLSPGYIITNILASDVDLGNNARLEYSFGKGNIDNMFTLDPISGLVTLQDDLSKSKQERYKLLIIVKDHGESEGGKSAMATLNIVINRTVDFAEASHITPQLKDNSSLTLGFHEKILIIIGATTLIIVSLLIVAIVCIKRRQVDQERDSYKYMCRVDMVNMKKDLRKHDDYSHENLNIIENNIDGRKRIKLNIDNFSASTDSDIDKKVINYNDIQSNLC
ncbi:hypothetical protein LSH36_54g07061 [Paralvinella palmiformis]|uniref:Cadherin domain-containing protein n=1 Tax=Paralvinella palmiformis TaxID=53620 RepID=A0AAD9K5M3_9ANNE|nr:hypothetical protein LSH36_54g07061 [Paralvinella palmiformis]